MISMGPGDFRETIDRGNTPFLVSPGHVVHDDSETLRNRSWGRIA